MSNNRYNKPKVDYTPREERKKVEEPTVALNPCCVCKKTITTGYYGSHALGGTCCKKCEDNFVQGDNHENAIPVNSFHGAIFSPR